MRFKDKKYPSTTGLEFNDLDLNAKRELFQQSELMHNAMNQPKSFEERQHVPYQSDFVQGRTLCAFAKMKFNRVKVDEFKVGNCNDISQCIALDLLEGGYQGRVEILSIGNHVFNVLDRAYDSDLDDPSTWGDRAVVLDGLLALTFPVSEIDTKLFDYEFVINTQKFDRTNYLVAYDKAKHTFIQAFDMNQEQFLAHTKRLELIDDLYSYIDRTENRHSNTDKLGLFSDIGYRPDEKVKAVKNLIELLKNEQPIPQTDKEILKQSNRLRKSHTRKILDKHRFDIESQNFTHEPVPINTTIITKTRKIRQ